MVDPSFADPSLLGCRDGIGTAAPGPPQRAPAAPGLREAFTVGLPLDAGCGEGRGAAPLALLALPQVL